MHTQKQKESNIMALNGSSKKRKTNIKPAKMIDGKLSPQPKMRSTLIKTGASMTSERSRKREIISRRESETVKKERTKTLISDHDIDLESGEGKVQVTGAAKVVAASLNSITHKKSRKRSIATSINEKKTAGVYSRREDSDEERDSTRSTDSDDQGEYNKISQYVEHTDWEQLEIKLATWTFDITLYESQQTAACLHLIFETFDIPDELCVSSVTMIQFFDAISKRYIVSNSYHNFYHAVDVTHTVYRFVKETQANVFLMPLETASLTIAALAHDVGHPGLSNQFLIKSKHETAILYNDQSPLENMHCATLYEIIRNSKVDVFKGLDASQWRAVRQVIIASILATDMVHHFSTISKLQVFHEMNGKKLQQEIITGQCNAETASGLMEISNR